jgi:hypothetical protein
MKTIITVSIVMLSICLIACDTNMEDPMSLDDLAALAGMEAAFTSAKTYNDSLQTYVDNTGVNNDIFCHRYDSVFHHYDSLYGVHHKRYSHQNNGDDHASNDWHMGSGWMNGMGSMNGMGNMHGGMQGSGQHGYNTNNCTTANIELMESLMESHDPYHFGN